VYLHLDGNGQLQHLLQRYSGTQVCWNNYCSATAALKYAGTPTAALQRHSSMLEHYCSVRAALKYAGTTTAALQRHSSMLEHLLQRYSGTQVFLPRKGCQLEAQKFSCTNKKQTQSFWLQIQRSGLDSQRYQIF
jgi:hypothetical protein